MSAVGGGVGDIAVERESERAAGLESSPKLGSVGPQPAYRVVCTQPSSSPFGVKITQRERDFVCVCGAHSFPWRCNVNYYSLLWFARTRSSGGGWSSDLVAKLVDVSVEWSRKWWWPPHRSAGFSLLWKVKDLQLSTFSSSEVSSENQSVKCDSFVSREPCP